MFFNDKIVHSILDQFKKLVVPFVSLIDTKTWGNRLQVEKYRACHYFKLCKGNPRDVIRVTPAWVWTQIFNREPVLQAGCIEFARCLCSHGGSTKRGTELHYRKCRIQHFWGLSLARLYESTTLGQYRAG